MQQLSQQLVILNNKKESKIMNREKILELGKKVLWDADYDTPYLHKYIDASIEAKAGLAEILSRHPNYNEEMGWIHFQYDTERKIDTNIIRKFFWWFDDKLNAGEFGDFGTMKETLRNFMRIATTNNTFGQYPPETPAREEGESEEDYTKRLDNCDLLTLANKLLKAKFPLSGARGRRKSDLLNRPYGHGS